MGVHPKEVLKQIMQMKNDGVQDGEEEEEEEEQEEENPYGDEVAS
jgi:tryptophanyl-tRNA synthetase